MPFFTSFRADAAWPRSSFRDAQSRKEYAAQAVAQMLAVVVGFYDPFALNGIPSNHGFSPYYHYSEGERFLVLWSEEAMFHEKFDYFNPSNKRAWIQQLYKAKSPQQCKRIARQALDPMPRRIHEAWKGESERVQFKINLEKFRKHCSTFRSHQRFR